MSLRGARLLCEKDINQRPTPLKLSGKDSATTVPKARVVKDEHNSNTKNSHLPQSRKRDRTHLPQLPPRKMPADSINALRNKQDSTTLVSRPNVAHRAKKPDIFDIWTTPVLNLDDDTLCEVFRHCDMAETLCVIASVCRRWRTIALDPSVWHSLHYEWVPFVKLMKALSKPGQFAPHLNHVRTLKVTNSPGNIKLSLPSPKIFPFKRLCKVRLANIYLDDLIELVAVVDGIKELWCDSIRKRQKTSHMVLTMFSRLQHLKVLGLHFEEECEHSGYTSQLSGLRQPLSSKLEVLAISNLCDSEFWFTLGQDLEHSRQPNEESLGTSPPWNMMEHSLMTKYKSFSQLRHLRSLSLGDCRAFTARVWRECLLPCGKQLTDISLVRWAGYGWRESPTAYRKRYDAAKQLEVEVKDIVEDVEVALAEFLGSLTNLHTLTLDKFACDEGVIRGVALLDQLDPCMQSSDSMFDGKRASNCRKQLLHHVKFVARQ